MSALQPLLAISKVTGGVTYQPSSITEALEALEAESMISLSERADTVTVPLVTGLSDLMTYAPSIKTGGLSLGCVAPSVSIAAPQPKQAS